MGPPGRGWMFCSTAQAFEVAFLWCLLSNLIHIPAFFSFLTLVFSTERCSWDSRNSAVSLHWLARPRCTIPCNRPAGICTASQIEESPKRWPSGCSLQVGRTEMTLLCCPLNSESTFSSTVLCLPHTSCWSHWSSTHKNLILKYKQEWQNWVWNPANAWMQALISIIIPLIKCLQDEPFYFLFSNTLLNINCALLLLQCWCWQNRVLHCYWHHARYGRKRRRCRHIQLCERASVSES